MDGGSIPPGSTNLGAQITSLGAGGHPNPSHSLRLRRIYATVYRIVEFEQGGEERATYGEARIKRLGEDLHRQFGRGSGWRI